MVLQRSKWEPRGSEEIRMIRFKPLMLGFAALGLAGPGGVEAQGSPATDAAPEQRSFCFRGGRRAECATFLVTELQGNAPLAQTTRRLVDIDGEVTDKRLFDKKQVQWEVGALHNLSDRWAVGATARVGNGTTHVITGATARARRWLSEDFAVDVAAGATFREVESTVTLAGGTGLVTDARLNFRDDAYVGLRFEQISLPALTGPEGRFDSGGEQRALSLLLGMGSEWGVGGTVLIGLGAAALVALLAGGGVGS
jgi:hypothetical protein